MKVKDPVRTLALGRCVKAAHLLADTAIHARRLVAPGLLCPLDASTVHTLEALRALAGDTIEALDRVLEEHHAVPAWDHGQPY